MENYQLLKYSDWVDKYRPIYKSYGNFLFETHVESDLKFLRANCAEDDLNIWTLVDGDDGELYIDSGWRFVNRLNYIVTEVPRESADILVQAEY